MEPRQRQAGFTLIELCVVVFILGLAASLVLPRVLGGAFEGARLRACAARIASAADWARSRAASTRRMHALYLDRQTGKYWVALATSPTGPGTGRTTRPDCQGRLPDGVGFLEVQVSGESTSPDETASIRFSPEGWADPAAVHLIGRKGDTASLAVSSLCGRIETFASRGNEG